MIVYIGVCNDDPRVLHKSVSWLADRNAQPKSPCSITKPTLMLQYNNNYISANYLYVDEWKRYYFIDDITLHSGGTCEISAHVDVLMSFQAEIDSLAVHVQRQERKRNPMLPDAYLAESAYGTEQILFSGSLGGFGSENQIVLELLGGGTND